MEMHDKIMLEIIFVLLIISLSFVISYFYLYNEILKQINLAYSNGYENCAFSCKEFVNNITYKLENGKWIR